ncbi:hypothetical protein [Rhodobacter sp. SY28-1]|uniref:hypothetical protein n=1 Tax=Rhodobacter sp. SY28-1 TaxID=2562317 RepID=UPI0010C15787|nr:hypothetical protein [Rhodobacter sp. SY28-1]
MTTLMILMPTGGQIDTPAVHSLLGLTQQLPKRGIAFALKTYEWSDLVISRNYLMSCFLADRKFTHALLLDSDMSYQPQLFFELLNFDADFTVAPYPQRQMRWQVFRTAIEREAAKPAADRAPTEQLLAESLRYNIPEVFEVGEPWPHVTRDGFRKVPGAGTGFMLIRREVPERMVQTGAALPVPGFNGPGYPGADFHDFFSHLRGRGGAVMHGEDTSFCRRWIDGCGGEIWCHETAQITHHGSLAYRGDYALAQKPRG